MNYQVIDINNRAIRNTINSTSCSHKSRQVIPEVQVDPILYEPSLQYKAIYLPENQVKIGRITANAQEVDMIRYSYGNKAASLYILVNLNHLDTRSTIFLRTKNPRQYARIEPNATLNNISVYFRDETDPIFSINSNYSTFLVKVQCATELDPSTQASIKECNHLITLEFLYADATINTINQDILGTTKILLYGDKTEADKVNNDFFQHLSIEFSNYIGPTNATIVYERKLPQETPVRPSETSIVPAEYIVKPRRNDDVHDNIVYLEGEMATHWNLSVPDSSLHVPTDTSKYIEFQLNQDLVFSLVNIESTSSNPTLKDAIDTYTLVRSRATDQICSALPVSTNEWTTYYI